jgi:PAS domain S-box-containing protein
VGYPRDELLGNRSDKVYPSIEEYEKVRKEKHEQIRKYGIGTVETRFKRKDGKNIDILLSTAAINPNNLEEGVAFTSLDITERNKMVKELKDSEEKFRSLVETTTDWIWEVNNEGVYTYSNPKVTELLGHEINEVLGKTPFYFMHPKEADRVGKVFHDFIEAEEPFYGLINKNMKKNGQEVVFETSGVPFFDTDGVLLGYRGIDRDVTEKQKSVQKIKEIMYELKRSNKDLEDFAYIVSHDLQEPLRMVSSFAQLLKKRYKDRLDKDANEFIDFMNEGTDIMRNLIDDLLKYSRVGTRAKPFKPVDINIIIDKIELQLQSSIKDSNARIVRKPLPVVTGDDTQILQLFQNLISNAIKFRGNKPPSITIDFKERDGFWEFSISDNGIGIDPKDFERIFIVFQRLHKKDEYEGTGIGLAICKKIVQLHGGNIWVESKKDQGATFFFTISKKMVTMEVLK